MGTMAIILGTFSLILSVPAIVLGRKESNKRLLINGVLALVAGLCILAFGFSV